MLDSLRAMYERELATLRRELLAYPDERTLWSVAPGTSNSAGTLTLHICGNLQHYVGARVGGTGYRRDRDAEFSRRDVPRKELLRLVDEATRMVGQTLSALDPELLQARIPDEIRGAPATAGYALLHVLAHLSYHLGQISYHRRMLS